MSFVGFCIDQLLSVPLCPHKSYNSKLSNLPRQGKSLLRIFTEFRFGEIDVMILEKI